MKRNTKEEEKERGEEAKNGERTNPNCENATREREKTENGRIEKLIITTLYCNQNTTTK